MPDPPDSGGISPAIGLPGTMPQSGSVCSCTLTVVPSLAGRWVIYRIEQLNWTVISTWSSCSSTSTISTRRTGDAAPNCAWAARHRMLSHAIAASRSQRLMPERRIGDTMPWTRPRLTDLGACGVAVDVAGPAAIAQFEGGVLLVF